MGSRRNSLLIPATMALVAALCLYKAIHLIENERPSNTTILVELTQGANFFEIRETRGEPTCVGSLHLSLEPSSLGSKIEAHGWLGLRLRGETITQPFSATFEFNPLSQLVTGFVAIPLKTEEVRVGLLEANPILVKVMRATHGAPTAQPVFEQRIPGPIELVKVNSLYQLQVPSLQNLPSLTSPPPYSHFTVVKTNINGCTSNPSTAIDLDPLLSIADRWIPVSKMRGETP